MMGYSNLLFFISWIYCFDITNTKKEDDNINIFEKYANLSKIKLLLNIFTDSLSPLIIIKISKKITKVESL